MGRVYEAWDPLLSRVVAVKATKLEHLDPRTAGEYLRRFAREAQAAGTLSHPAIVKVFDVGPDYLVMEKIEGPTLKELLQTQRHFELEQVVRILRPVAEALDHAHRAGVIHRDVKPANIIVQPDGMPKLMDFGVAYVASSIVTGKGEVVGSPCYMSPEQIVGEDAGGATDVYALAVVAYEMLTGRPPFLGTVTQVIYKVVHEAAPLVRETNPALPARYDEVLARALDKNAAHRFATAAELVAELAPRAPGESLAVATRPAPPRPFFPLVDTVAWRSPRRLVRERRDRGLGQAGRRRPPSLIARRRHRLDGADRPGRDRVGAAHACARSAAGCTAGAAGTDARGENHTRAHPAPRPGCAAGPGAARPGAARPGTARPGAPAPPPRRGATRHRVRRQRPRS